MVKIAVLIYLLVIGQASAFTVTDNATCQTVIKSLRGDFRTTWDSYTQYFRQTLEQSDIDLKTWDSWTEFEKNKFYIGTLTLCYESYPNKTMQEFMQEIFLALNPDPKETP